MVRPIGMSAAATTNKAVVAAYAQLSRDLGLPADLPKDDVDIARALNSVPESHATAATTVRDYLASDDPYR